MSAPPLPTDADLRPRGAIPTRSSSPSGPAPIHWRTQAACLSEDPELFFPIGNTGPALAQIEEARQVCLSCQVRSACLAWALDAGILDGVWGGLSEDERRSWTRRQRTLGNR